MKTNILKYARRFASYLVALSLIFCCAPTACTHAAAFDLDYITTDGMELGYSIIRGYSKLSIESGQYTNGKYAVYCGLDVSDLYTMSVLGWFYITNGVDLDRAMTDNDYAMQLIEKLDSALSGAGIKNERAANAKSEITKGAKVYSSFDTVGLYIIGTSSQRAKELMKDRECTDFVLDGGCVPSNMKDLNFDGKTDMSDAKLIQQLLVGVLRYSDSDEKQYAYFVADINGDKTPDIKDVTYIYKNR